MTDSESENEEVDVPEADETVDSPEQQVEAVEPADEAEQADDEQAKEVPEPAPELSTSFEMEPEDVAEPEAVVETAEQGESEMIEKLADETSQQSDASTIENESLKQILERHERFDVPLIPDAGVLITDRDLSTIVEERTFDQSVVPGLNQTDRATLESLQEEPEDMATAPETEKLVEDEPGEADEPEKVAASESSEPSEQATETVHEPEQESGCKVDTLDAGMMNEDAGEPLNLTDNEEEEQKQQVEAKKRGRAARSKSLRLSQVPLPFTSRKSVWDASSRDRSPESATSEPPQSLEEAPEASKGRRRRHSASLSSAPLPTRRSTRRSTQLNDTLGTPVKEEPSTPPKSGRRSRLADEKDPDDAFIPPSVDVSPAESSYSGRSSLVGTPVRRSARIAMKERTPEPSMPTEALMSSLSRVRRHSTGPGDVASPVRRSGRKSLNTSRDNSPDSITSEPPPRTESTPSRRTKSTRGLRSAQKVALNLFPVEEEGEAVYEAPSVRDSDDSVSIDDAESVADASIASVSSKRTRKPRGQQTSRPPSVASSVASSPGATRYNLRRTRRTSELDIVPEEEQNRAEEAKAAESNKRVRDTASEDSSPEHAGLANEEDAEQLEKTKRPGRPKRRKKAEEEEEPTGKSFLM